MKLRLLSVCVGLPRIIGTYDGEPVLSGFVKAPVDAEHVFVGATNIKGDSQADLTVHGGPDKAVYAYPSDHWGWWEAEHRLVCKAATFGENLTIAGAVESAVAVGDRFRWGDALLEISQPRAPCFKFAISTARADAPQIMTLSARCGWYYRVIEEGSAPVRDAALLREYESGAPSVRDAFLAATHPNVAQDARRRVRDIAALSPAWRDAVTRRLH